MRVNIQPYNPAWPRAFAQIESSLELILRAHSVPFLAIEHVGSTAVPGLAAKPIIDIDIVVAASALNAAIAALTASNDTATPSTGSADSMVSAPTTVNESYTYLGERGIPGRHALREPGLDGGDEGGGDEERHTRNVYVCIEGCLSLRNHIAIRNTLRRDEALRREHEEVKWAAAQREWESVEGYVEAKTEVLVKVLQKSGGFGAGEVGEVVGVNARGGRAGEGVEGVGR